jgi:hypothetical protein
MSKKGGERERASAKARAKTKTAEEGARPRGRPKTNPVSIHLTLLPEVLARVDKWADAEGVSRLKACRQLIERGLDAPTPNKRRPS